MGVHVNCDCLIELSKNLSQVFAENTAFTLSLRVGKNFGTPVKLCNNQEFSTR